MTDFPNFFRKAVKRAPSATMNYTSRPRLSQGDWTALDSPGATLLELASWLSHRQGVRKGKIFPSGHSICRSLQCATLRSPARRPVHRRPCADVKVTGAAAIIQQTALRVAKAARPGVPGGLSRGRNSGTGGCQRAVSDRPGPEFCCTSVRNNGGEFRLTIQVRACWLRFVTRSALHSQVSPRDVQGLTVCK